MANLYNVVFGVNPLADELLNTLGLERAEVGRFRDCYLQRRPKDGELQIHVLTRNGGGNREACAAAITHLRSNGWFVVDYDEPSDTTFATFVYALPCRETWEALVRQDGASIPAPFGAREAEFARKMREQPTDPEVLRVTAALRPALERVAQLQQQGARAVALLDSDGPITDDACVVRLGVPR